jgi:hypothetical protein
MPAAIQQLFSATRRLVQVAENWGLTATVRRTKYMPKNVLVRRWLARFRQAAVNFGFLLTMLVH